jgi:hypothetical protein
MVFRMARAQSIDIYLKNIVVVHRRGMDPDNASIFILTEQAQTVLSREFHKKDIMFAYENITHDGFDVNGEPESTIYHLYIFVNDGGRLWYFTTTYEQRFFEGEILVYKKPSGMPMDSFNQSYLGGILRRIKDYFKYHLDDSRIYTITQLIRMMYDEAAEEIIA